MKKIILFMTLLFTFNLYAQDQYMIRMSSPSHDGQCEVLGLLNLTNTKLKIIQLEQRTNGLDINDFNADTASYNHIGYDYDLTQFFNPADIVTISAAAKRTGPKYEIHLNYTTGTITEDGITNAQNGTEKFDLKSLPFFSGDQKAAISDCVAENPIAQ